MSDSLRDRIAAALRGHGPMGAYYRDGLEFCSCGAETDGLLEFEAHLADAVIEALELTDTLRLLRAAQIWIADAISEDDTGEPWLMTRMLLNNLVSRVDALEGYNDRFPA